MSLPRTRLFTGLFVLALALAATPTVAHAATHTRTLRVLTFNIHHGAGPDDVLDLDATARTIATTHADAVGLQEVDRHWSARSDFLDEAAWLGRRLHMHVAYGANLDEDPGTTGTQRRQYGTAILSRYPILTSTNTPLTKGGDPTTEQRGLLYARLLVHGTPVRFYNTHLQHTSAAVRQAQATQITGLIGATDEPTVLTGDLNADPGTPELTTLTTRYPDVWPVAGTGPGYTYPSSGPHSRIDYILTTAHPTTAAVLPAIVSDHLPTTATLTFPG